MNHVVLIGRMAQDPEVRYTQSGKAVASFSLAVDRRGEGTDFISVVAWEKLAEVVGNNLAKGRKVAMEGRLSVRSYEDKDGNKRRVTEVVATNVEFVDSKPKSDGASPAESMGQVSEEEIPF